MNKNPQYRISLKPLGKFFFAGEQNFGTDGQDNYLAISEKMPMQTSLLGMLRYELLMQQPAFRQEALYPGTAPQALPGMEALIGPSSFSFDDPAQTFGAIRYLSPVFVYQHSTDAYFHPAPLNFHFQLTGGNGDYALTKRDNPAEHWNPKNNLAPDLVSQGGMTLGWGHVLMPVSQPGIKRPEDGTEVGENAYYEQRSYVMHKDFEFVCFADFDEGAAPQNGLTSIGGDRSRFAMRVEAARTSLADLIYKGTDNFPFFFLYSHAYAASDLGGLCRFALLQTVDTQHLTSAVAHTQNYGNVSAINTDLTKSRKMAKSGRRVLLKAGSVLYPAPGQEGALAQALAHASAQSIGLNHFYSQ